MLSRPVCPIRIAIVAWILSSQAALAETPEYYRRLIDEAGVSFAFYDPVREPKPYRGHTTFRLEVFYESSFQYRWNDGPAGRNLNIRTEIGKFRYKLTNQIDLPRYLEKLDRWNDSLVRHEFDHVAMTVDPRVRLLIEHLCRRVTRVARRMPLGSPIDDNLVQRIIREEVEPRNKAVIDLLIANEQAFDAATAHGSRPLADREDYFRTLFSEANLKERGFPYLAEVGDLVRQKAYREASLPYDFGKQ